MPFSLAVALRELHQRRGSDLHLKADAPATVRVLGDLVPIDNVPVTENELTAILESIANEKLVKAFREKGEVDFRYSIPDLCHYRVNFYKTFNGTAAAFREIPASIPSLEELGVNPDLKKLSMLDSGLVLVTGPTGSGKSTVTAALIDYANQRRKDHILTIEDPIEFIYQDKSCFVSQREVGTHSQSFADALRVALREDPDIIVVGEMRDYETVSLAIEAAETGHLVFATLHTRSAAQTVDRIIDIFPSDDKAQIRASLADSLQAVMSVALMKAADGTHRVQAMEILMANPAIRNLIREGKTHQIPNVLQTGKAQGMCTMDDALEDLLREGEITRETALKYARNPDKFKSSPIY